MYNEFYDEQCGQPNIDNSEIYFKNNQIYDNETRETVKESETYNNLPRSLQNPINAACRCGSKFTNIIPKLGGKSGMTTSNTVDSSKFTLHLSLTITEIIEILILIMIVVLIAITIRTRSRILVFSPPQTNTKTNTPTQ
jgi:hypothetical protein